MKSLNAVLRLPADEFFGYVRGIDYGYMDAEGVVHRISPADNCADQNGAPPTVFLPPNKLYATIAVGVGI